MTYPPPCPSPHSPVRRWWQHPALIIVALFILPPAGIALAWVSQWNQAKKIIATVLAGLWFLTPLLGDPPKETQADAKPAQHPAATKTPAITPTVSQSAALSYVGKVLKDAKAVAYADGYNAISHDASPDDASQWDDDNWRVCFQTQAAKPVGKMPTLDFGVVRNEAPCPAKDGDPLPYPKMPKVVSLTFSKASETFRPIGLKAIEPQSAYTDVTLPATVDDWTVCFQDPAEGKEIKDPKTVTAYLKVAAPGTACPTAEHTQLHPDPEVPGDRDDSGNSSSGGASTGGAGGSVYYKNCTAVRAAGAAPIRRGDPGYGRHLDKDGDGVACE